jgi:hypothetical protein
MNYRALANARRALTRIHSETTRRSTMSISLDAIYQPLNQFFLQKFGQGDAASIFFRFSESPIGIYDSDFVVPSHPEWGSSPALAAEQFSYLVDKITRLDPSGHGVWLDPLKISDLYHDEILGPAIPFIPADADPDAKQARIEAFGQIKADADSRWSNCKAESVIPGGAEYRPSRATPQNWWNKSDPGVWTPQQFQIKGASSATPEQPSGQLLRMKISDSAIQTILQGQRIQVRPPTAPPGAVVHPTGAPQGTPLSHPIAAMASPQMIAPKPAAGQPVTIRPELTTAMHTNLMAQAFAIPASQRMVLQSAIIQHAPTQSVAVTDVKISFDYCLVAAERAWIHTAFLNSKLWFIPGQQKGSLSANDGHGVPALPTGFVVLKNLLISAPWTPDDITHLEQSIQFGPFLIDSTVTNGAIGHAGLQVVGWILQKMPDLPPVGDVSLPNPEGTLPSSTPVGTTSQPAPSTQPTVLSSGRALLKGTYIFDFDKGTLDPSGDLWWEQKDGIARFLVPLHGAMVASIGGGSFEAVTGQALGQQQYSTTPIDGSNNGNNSLLPGTIVGIKTKSGHYAKMCIQSYGYDLDISWVTYQ